MEPLRNIKHYTTDSKQKEELKIQTHDFYLLLKHITKNEWNENVFLLMKKIPYYCYKPRAANHHMQID